MQINWLAKNYSYQKLILAGDVGGTNANIGLIAQNDHGFTVVADCVLKTPAITDFAESLKSVLAEFQKTDPSLKPDSCCISAAGPIIENRCKLSNSSLIIDQQSIQNTIGIKTCLINDFLAISYGLALLDIEDSKQITVLRNTPQIGCLRAVAGAGTGLGVGIFIEQAQEYKAFPSEGGHMLFAPFDDETKAFYDYLAKGAENLIEAESFVSGKGIINAFNFFKDVKKCPPDEIISEIGRAPESSKPQLISEYAAENAFCHEVLKLFIKCYAGFAANLAAVLIPTMGLYLAGGIVTKNKKYFAEEDFFINCFDKYFPPNVKDLTGSIPVYIVNDYSVSLYGAANFACCIKN